MTITLRTLLFLTLSVSCLLSGKVMAQQEISVSEKAMRLLQVLDEGHVMVRSSDSLFGKRIHNAFMDLIDPNQVFYTKEDLLAFEEESASILMEIEFARTNYLDLVKNTWEKRRAKVLSVIGRFGEQTLTKDASLVRDSIFMEHHVAEADFEKKWEAILRNYAIQDALDYVTDTLPLSNDSIVALLQNSVQQTSSVYQEYIESLDAKTLDNLYLNAIARSYDPHSSYFSFAQNEEFKEELSSERAIFGISYGKNADGEMEIQELYPGSSAWLSGQVHVGDVMVKVKFGNRNAVSTKGKSSREISQLFDELRSDTLTLTLKDETNKERVVELIRSKVYSDGDVIKSAILEGDSKVGYISLPDFYTNWMDDEGLGCAHDLAKALIKMKKESIDGVILDLRDNGGGSVKEAIDIIGIFIDFGPVLIVKDTAQKPHTFKDFNRGTIYSGPLIVMINEGSASASEVVAGALQDYNRAVIVGRRSFGKATGQRIIPIAPNEARENQEQMNEWGFASTTLMGLYRINLSTNQAAGVQPDIELPDPFHTEIRREEDYANVLQLGEIDKKMYYTPLPKIDLSGITDRSKQRYMQEGIYPKVEAIVQEYDHFRETVADYGASFEELLEVHRHWIALQSKVEGLYDKLEQPYGAKSAQYDDEIYRMNAYLNGYKESFLARIAIDYELFEAYSILTELISNP